MVQDNPGIPEPTIEITVVGLIRVEKRYTAKETPDGGFEGNGYGFMGRYPVQVLVRR